MNTINIPSPVSQEQITSIQQAVAEMLGKIKALNIGEGTRVEIECNLKHDDAFSNPKALVNISAKNSDCQVWILAYQVSHEGLLSDSLNRGSSTY